MVSDCKKLFPTWLQRRLEVIPLVYAQQKQMYDNHNHKCEDRIVSLEQPHVRPIQRGKRPNPTEFGQKLHLSVVDGFTYLEQTSWSNFNEGCDLTAVVEAMNAAYKLARWLLRFFQEWALGRILWLLDVRIAFFQ